MVFIEKDGVPQRMCLDKGKLKMLDGSSVEEYLKEQGFKDGEVVCIMRPACLQRLFDNQFRPLGS